MCSFKLRNEAEYQQILNQFEGKLKIVDQGKIKFFLKLHIDYDRMKKCCKINNPLFIEELLKEYNVESSKEKPTPLEYALNLRPENPVSEEEASTILKLGFRELLGKIGYLACTVRPDLAIVISIHEQTK